MNERSTVNRRPRHALPGLVLLLSTALALSACGVFQDERSAEESIEAELATTTTTTATTAESSPTSTPDTTAPTVTESSDGAESSDASDDPSDEQTETTEAPEDRTTADEQDEDEPEEQESELPLAMPEPVLGDWRSSDNSSVTAAECSYEGPEAGQNFGKIMTISQEGFTLFEEGGVLLEVHDRTDNRIEATFDTTYADTVVNSRMTFELQSDGALVVITQEVVSTDETGTTTETVGTAVRYVRCPADA